MKVAMDVRLAWFAGPGRSLRTLIEALAQADGVELVLFGPRRYAELATAGRSRLAFIACETAPFSIREQIDIPRLLRSTGADLAHFPYYNFALGSPIPVVVTIHDLLWYHPEHVSVWRPATQYSRFMIRQAMRRAAGVLTVSGTARGQLVQRFPWASHRIHVTPNALSDNVRGALAAEASRGREDNLLLNVGTAKPWKRAGLLIAAAGRLRQQGRPIRVVFAGTPARNENADIRGLAAAAGISEAVEFRGPISDRELAELYRSATVYVMPSVHEGFSLTTLEALAGGCPVVAADLPVHREVAGEAARYFEPDSVDGLVRELGRLLDDPDEQESLRRRGFGRIGRYTPRAFAEATLDAYRAALDS